jgi:DNA repair exonuclease SbcCD nuclease subunit
LRAQPRIFSSGFDPAVRQRSEQNFTCAQSRDHFFRQVNGNPQAAHSLVGNSDFFRILAMLLRPVDPSLRAGILVGNRQEPRPMDALTTQLDDIVLVHSSDLHVDDDHTADVYDGDGTGGLRVVLHTARTHRADIALLVGDIFDHNRMPPDILARAAQLMAEAGMTVVILPGNHDPLTPDSCYIRGNFADIPNVHIIGLTHPDAVAFPRHDLEIWGHPHHSYDNMVPLRQPRPRTTRWQVALAHGHYEEDGAEPLRPSWLISDAEIDATGADYLAMGHWNRPAKVGTGLVPAYYSGSPELARTLNLIRLKPSGVVEISREPLLTNRAE